MFQIEKGIPTPQSIRWRKYPFADMAEGDSFSVAVAAGAATLHRVRSAAYAYGRDHGKTFICRKQPDGSLRVWRTA